MMSALDMLCTKFLFFQAQWVSLGWIHPQLILTVSADVPFSPLRSVQRSHCPLNLSHDHRHLDSSREFCPSCGQDTDHTLELYPRCMLPGPFSS